MRVSTATYAAIAINALRMILRKTLRPRSGKHGETDEFDLALYGLYGLYGYRQTYYFVIANTDSDYDPQVLERTCKELAKVLDKCNVVAYTGTSMLGHPEIQRTTGWQKRVPVSFSEVSSMPPGDVARALSGVLRNNLKDYDPVCF